MNGEEAELTMASPLVPRNHRPAQHMGYASARRPAPCCRTTALVPYHYLTL
jgi:hypothetical protein